MGDREMLANKPRNRHAKEVRENPQYAERADRGTKMKAQLTRKPKYANWMHVQDDDDEDDFADSNN